MGSRKVESERKRLVARLEEIKARAAEIAAQSDDRAVVEAANLAEEACSHAERLDEIGKGD